MNCDSIEQPVNANLPNARRRKCRQQCKVSSVIVTQNPRARILV